MKKSFWTIPLAASLALTACSGSDGDPSPTPTVTATESASGVSSTPGDSPTSQSEASIDVDSDGNPSADAQDASGEASLGTAVATVSIQLPDEWQYEGTHGDGVLPYAVLVDAGEPFDLSAPGSDAYKNSVWVQVETYRVGGESPYGDKVPDDADDLAHQIADATGGDGETFTSGDIPIVHVSYTNDDGLATDDLLARHGDVWILARPTNVDVDDYLDAVRGGDTNDGILHAVLESSSIK
ncbi:hypothetical protein [Demequina aurantiaca]|uniref:hypothetical protein n=1 Tax=Demequina aurantiaca TaxID=676200 RepID=UPI00078469CE|nr:hypothetical protein [Demequina aurantiaca]